MMKRICAILMLAVLLALPAVLAGCGTASYAETAAAAAVKESAVCPAVGSWHAEVKLSDIDAIPFWARALIAIAAGNTAFEVDVEFSGDGTFTYLTNTEAMKDTITDSANTVLGFFLKDLDLSVFIDRAAEAILPETVMGRDRDCFGDFSDGEGGVIFVDTTTGETLRFRVFGRYLVQLDSDGGQVLKFKKA